MAKVGIRRTIYGARGFVVFHGSSFVAELCDDRAYTARAAGMKQSDDLKVDIRAARNFSLIRAVLAAKTYATRHNLELTAACESYASRLNGECERTDAARDALKAAENACKPEAIDLAVKMTEEVTGEHVTTEQRNELCEKRGMEALKARSVWEDARDEENEKNRQFLEAFDRVGAERAMYQK